MTVATTWRVGALGVGTLVAAGIVGITLGGASARSATLWTVLGAGLIDGINPCAIALLFIFVSILLAAVERQVIAQAEGQRRILLGASTYIAGIYVTYLALGIGLLSGSTVLQETHLTGRIAAFVALALGLVTIQEALVPEWGQRLVMPAALHGSANRWLRKAAGPGIFVAGALIALCTVPCSGSVYLATLGLLSAQATYLKGVGYLALYNLMFVAPLLLIAVTASSRPTFRLLGSWQVRRRGFLKLSLGAATIAVGLMTLAVM